MYLQPLPPPPPSSPLLLYIDIYNCFDDPCGENAECRNVNETFECYCTSGYQLVNETDCEGKNLLFIVFVVYLIVVCVFFCVRVSLGYLGSKLHWVLQLHR